MDSSETPELDLWPSDLRGFSNSKDGDYILKLVQSVRDNHVSLTLVSAVDNICQQSLLIKISDNSLQIDKPLDWDKSVDSFRVFFRDMQQRWNFFLASNLTDFPFSLTIAMPEELHTLQRRSCSRVKVPFGTRALVKTGNDIISTVFVNDLSAAGMSMCNDPTGGDYATDSVIKDIVVSIPNSTFSGESRASRKVLPLISQGRIVRSFVDHETSRPCYGISFDHDSNYVKETIRQAVSEFEREILSASSYSPN